VVIRGDHSLAAVNVLHISESDGIGGSGRSAFRLHSGLRALGHGSRMLVGRRATSDRDVRPLKRSIAWRAGDRVAGTVADLLNLQYIFFPSSFGVVNDPWFKDADVVQLYNTHGSYFSHSALPLLSRRRPVVWRLSDMWAFTGHVAYSYDCERWRHGCGTCPYPNEYPALSRDTTALLWQWKNQVYRRSRLTIVAPSRWIERLARESPLLSRFPIRWIPNGVDLEQYKPVDRRAARAELGLPPDGPVVLFSAPDISDRRKGGAVLNQALGRLLDLDFGLIVAGANETPPFPRSFRSLLHLTDEREIALSYAAADVFVLPTLAENLPNAAIESIACGTPCVSFDVGGMPDVVRHLETGYLAKLGDADDLANGVRTLLGDDELRQRLSEASRELAEREFSRDLEASRFVELYEELAA
jgi:glycosyltransferase involved in cell wall biosynthesis